MSEKYRARVEQARRMVEAFAALNACRFDLTLTDIDGCKQSFWSALEVRRLQRELWSLLPSAIARHHNVIVRPRGAAVQLVQLDDLNCAEVERVRTIAFLVLATSPGNHQAWVALRETAPDWARQLRQGIGADPSASGATRIAGSANFKREYAPDFPAVRLREMNPHRVVSGAHLLALDLVAAPALRLEPRARVSWGRNRRWPSYQQCLQNAPLAHRNDRSDVSRADFTFCLIALDWGWGSEDICQRLSVSSRKAREQGEIYVRLTVQRAVEALQRRNAGRLASAFKTPEFSSKP
ncbi:MAG TPA: DNA-primase RepB domain-containing protein [Bryobacteraceae bacterium]|jgi:hypothetical protein